MSTYLLRAFLEQLTRCIGGNFIAVVVTEVEHLSRMGEAGNKFEQIASISFYNTWIEKCLRSRHYKGLWERRVPF